MSSGTDVIDEEEFLTIKKNKKARAEYRVKIDQLKEMKSALSLAKRKALQVSNEI